MPFPIEYPIAVAGVLIVTQLIFLDCNVEPTAAVATMISVSTDEEPMRASGTRELMVGVLFLGKRKDRI